MKKNRIDKQLEILSEDLETLSDYTKSLWQFLPLPLCYINPLGFILDANQSFETFSSWSLLEIVGKPFDIIFSKKDTREIINQTLKKGKISNYETILLTKTDEKIVVAVYSQSRKDKEGNVIGFFLTLIDIRESKKFQEELQKKVEERTEELQEKVAELERFNRLAVGREIRMIELKEEIKRLKERIGKLEGGNNFHQKNFAQ